jgi:L-galactose dehydrogenase
LIYHPLGKTGVQVSTIGFGASALGDVFGAITLETAIATVRYAMDSGINFFDVSPYYGVTLAEERLGDALQGRRHEVLLATKCGRYGYDAFDFSAATITRGLEDSLHRLRTDYVDLLQVHDVEFGSIAQIMEETLPAMRALQQQGKVRMIGITGYWPGLLARMLRQVHVDTVLNYCHSNLLMDDMDTELTPVATELGVGLINASPLHMGLLGGGPVAKWHPAPVVIKDAAAKIVGLCEEQGVRAPIVALSQCLSHKGVASTLVGFRSVAEIDEALLALEGVHEPELMRNIQKIVEPIRNVSWASGLAENQPATHSNSL